MNSNDNETNVIKLERKEKPQTKKPKTQKQVVATVSLKERDISVHFPQAEFTLMLKPRAAFELAMLILQAIRAGADKYLPKDKQDD